MNEQIRSVSLTIFVILAAIFMLSYSGNLAVNDEFMMFNVAASRVRFQDTQYDLALWYAPPTSWDSTQLYPLQETDIDPLQMIVAMPLYWLGYHLPGVGLVHTVWLMNVLLGALAGVLMARYALLRGYSTRTAVAAAFSLGLLTALWVYSQTFYREPLALTLLLLTLLLIEHWRQAYRDGQRGRGGVYLLSGIIAAVLMILTKSSLNALIPALILYALPLSSDWQKKPRIWQAASVVIGLLLALAVVMAFTSIVARVIPDSEIEIGSYVVQTDTVQTALRSYFFSIGGSIWGTSPILLLALPGAWLLWRYQREWQVILTVIVGLLGVGLVYGLLHSTAWFAGASWPPRFFIPLIPLPLILALPVIEAFVHHRLPRWMNIAIVLLAVYSLWWQVSGLLFKNGTYSANLPAESGGLASWLPGMNNPRYIRPVVLTEHLFSADRSPINLAWTRTDEFIPPLLFLIVLLLGLWLLRQSTRGTVEISNRQPLAVLLLLVIVTGWSIHSIYDDPRYLGDNQSLHDMLGALEVESKPNDVVILSDPVYNDFVMNYAKVDNVRWVTLASHPGERGSFEQELQVVSDNPDDLLSEPSPEQIHALAQQRDHLWVLMETGPFLPWSIRPVERFMAKHYYALREVTLAPTVRLLKFATVAQATADHVPEVVETHHEFGEQIRLQRVEFPLGTNLNAGDTLSFSLFWTVDAPIEESYTIATFLADPANQQPVLQAWDAQPELGFAPTNTWEAGEIVQDNHAIALPSSLPEGNYTLWVRLYRIQDGEIVTLPVTSGDKLEDDLALLPVRMHISH